MTDGKRGEKANVVKATLLKTPVERFIMRVCFYDESDERSVVRIMITSNLPFSKWENIFKDPMMTAAAVDRIVHHSVILELNIDSYRMNAAKNRNRMSQNSLF